MPNEFVYVLDSTNKVIHAIANVSEACDLEAIIERHDVEGLNQEAVNSGEWSFCENCSAAAPQETAEEPEATEESEAETEEEEKAEAKPKRTRRSTDE